jgi:hypothetical protein
VDGAPARGAGPSAPLIVKVLLEPELLQLLEIICNLVPVFEFRFSRVAVEQFSPVFLAGELIARDTVVVLFRFIAAAPYFTAPLAGSLLLFAV